METTLEIPTLAVAEPEKTTTACRTAGMAVKVLQDCITILQEKIEEIRTKEVDWPNGIPLEYGDAVLLHRILEDWENGGLTDFDAGETALVSAIQEHMAL